MVGRFRALALAGTAALGLGFVHEARAGAFGLREQSAQAQGLAFAGAAAGSGGVSSMFWNPAVITMRPGTVVEGNLTYIGLNAEITPTIGTTPAFLPLGGSGNIGQGAVVPAVAASTQIGDRLWLGLQVGAPFGLVTKPRQVWAGEVYGRSSRVFSFAFNPVIAYQVTDWLSIAAGPSVEYFRLTLRQAVPVTASPLTYPSGFIKGDSVGVGFTAGATITPREGTVIGVGYRSSVHHDIEGSIGVPPVPFLVPLGGQVKARLNTPEKVSFGLIQALSPQMRVDFGFEYDNWSRVGTIGIVSKTLGVPVNVLPLNFRDNYYFALGGEYDVSPDLTLRAGVGYEQVPIDTRNRSVRLPDNDRYNISIGASYRYSDAIDLHAAYSHVFLNRSRLNGGPGFNYDSGVGIALAGIVDASADIVSVGLRYSFNPPPPAAPAPLLSKY